MVRRKRELDNHVEEHWEDWDDSVSSNSKLGKLASILGDTADKEANSNSCSYSQKRCQDYKISEIGGVVDSVADKKLAIFFISNNIALDKIEAPSFVDFVRLVAESGLKYKLPSSLMFQSKSFPEVEMEVEKYVTNVRQSWTIKGCTIMLGMWKNFINISAYSPEGAVFLKLQEIPKCRKAKFDVKDIVSSVIEDIGADHVVQIITNNDTIYDSIKNMLLCEYPQIYQIWCAAHEVHSLLKAIYNEVGWVHVTINHAKLIVNCMYEDDIILSLMRRYTNCCELKHPCRTKFASNYQMLQSVLGNKNELQQLVESEDWSLLDNKKRTKKVTGIIQSGNFWSQVQEVLNVMEPLVRVLRLVEDDRSTLGYLYEAMEKARKTIGRHYSNDHTKYQMILDLFQKWRSNKIIHPIHAAAAFLNPAYMCSDNFKFNVEMRTGIDFVFSTMVRNEEKEKFIEEVELYRAKIPKMFNAMAHELLKVSHPRVWWDYTGVYLPILKKYAIRILSQPCKCSCDLKPSAFDVAQTKMMNRAVSVSHDNFVYTTMNAKIMENFRSLEEQNLMPIDLENCNELPDYVDPKQGWWEDQMELISESSDDDEKNETDISHLDGKDYRRRSCPVKARRRWRKITIVICISNYLGLQRKKWTDLQFNEHYKSCVVEEERYNQSSAELLKPLIFDTDSMIEASQICFFINSIKYILFLLLLNITF